MIAKADFTPGAFLRLAEILKAATEAPETPEELEKIFEMVLPGTLSGIVQRGRNREPRQVFDQLLRSREELFTALDRYVEDYHQAVSAAALWAPPYSILLNPVTLQREVDVFKRRLESRDGIVADARDHAALQTQQAEWLPTRNPRLEQLQHNSPSRGARHAVHVDQLIIELRKTWIALAGSEPPRPIKSKDDICGPFLDFAWQVREIIVRHRALLGAEEVDMPISKHALGKRIRTLLKDRR